MKSSVYYFSGTGNTLFIARTLARQLDGALIPIAQTAGTEELYPDADVVGIVYPVYYNDLPAIVRDFAGKLRGISRTYLFAVCNYGGCGSQSVKSLGELFKASGGELALSHGIHMPQNAFSKPWENHLRLIAKAERKTATIAEDIIGRKKGNNLTGLLNFVFVRLHRTLLPGIRANLAKRTGLSPETELNALIRAGDRPYTAGDACTGCGVCVNVCPVGNIMLDGGRPKWLGRCENCLACYDWCPAKAIEGGVASRGYHYRNPRITAADIMAQKA